jgi:hypothetical protein
MNADAQWVLYSKLDAAGIKLLRHIVALLAVDGWTEIKAQRIR